MDVFHDRLVLLKQLHGSLTSSLLKVKMAV